MSDSLIEDVSDTAFMAAAYRAAESERPDALFRDPLAARLAGERGKMIVAGLPARAFIGGGGCELGFLFSSAASEEALPQTMRPTTLV